MRAAPSGKQIELVFIALRIPRSMALEILHRTLMLFRGGARFEGAEITTSASFGIHFAGIQPVFA
jgi:hypothetical protein